MRRRESMLRRPLTAAAISAVGVLMMVPPARAAVTPSMLVSNRQVTTTVPARAARGAVMVTTFSPTKGPMGTKVTIIGSGFTRATKVAFHGIAASFKVISNTRITATAPCGATRGRITVSTPKGKATSTGSFRVT